jgi:hypothetical protein
MTEHGSDQPVLKHIERLVREEHDLYGHEKLSDRGRQRLKQLEVELDQCWDLLRQRRARRDRVRAERRRWIGFADLLLPRVLATSN